jgi:uncharacterized membrane protein HdeD (DUF308 family)
MSQQSTSDNRNVQPKEVSSTESKWQRRVLGASAALLLGAGLILAAWPGMETGSGEYFSGTLLKVGVVLGVGWLAAPQLERFGWHRLRGTLLAALIIVLVLWAIKPRIGAWAGAILLGGGAFFALIGWFRSLFDNNPSRSGGPRT